MQDTRIYNYLHISSAIFLTIALAWLTVSTPFVYHEQVKYAKAQMEKSGETEDIPNPFANTTEEKTEENVSGLSEYLHDLHSHVVNDIDVLKHEKCHEMELYIAYHGELLSPPPEA